MSSSEKFINKYLAFFIVLMVVIVTGSYLMQLYHDNFNSEHDLYLNQVREEYAVTEFLLSYLGFLVLYNFLIPISLYVTIEMHKFIGAFFLEWDPHLYDEELNQPCIVNTSDLNEELGQINILFSDKTGTLTKNEMIFKKCSISGKVYDQSGRGLHEVGKRNSCKISECPKNVYTFFEALALCHTVQVAEPAQDSNSKVPVIFQKSINELGVEEVDFHASKLDFQAVNHAAIVRKHNKANSVDINTTFPLRRSTEDLKVLSHRRTKSSVPFDNPQKDQKPPFQRLTSQRTSLREYYAAPSFTSAQLLERQESMLNQQPENFIDYCASSSDEKALVEASAKLGIVYLNDKSDIFTLWRDELADTVQFKRLQVLEFTSDRKRMSVIVMDKNAQIWLICKGAESHVLPLCKDASHLISQTQKQINDFAKVGLRTLAIARRKMTKAEFLQFNSELIEANSSLENRISKVESCQREIETGLELLGATAVEDALQDDVKDTLESLRSAGIKIWVLTGDKVETALNIAHSCGHISEDADKYFIVDCANEYQLSEHLSALEREFSRNPLSEIALLIDGSSLKFALLLLPERFRDVAYKCHAVLCCRLSPLQKSEVVRLVKTVKEKPVTAAIGDGANDVSMLQEAHVSLGIIGKEGRQAARCSDYAFVKFSMIKRMILLHGHYFSQRLSLLVLYFFYKNLVLIGCLLFFQANSMFSAQSVYDPLFLTLFNVTYTTLPILLISITEKNHAEEKLLSNPSLYKLITKNSMFAWRHFNTWLFLALYHSAIIYYFTRAVWSENNAVYDDGKTAEFFCFGLILIHNVVLITNLKIVIEANYRSFVFLATVWLSLFGFVITSYMYNVMNGTYDVFLVYRNLLSSLFFWMMSIIIMVAALLPDLTIKLARILDIKTPILSLFVWVKDRLTGFFKN